MGNSEDYSYCEDYKVHIYDCAINGYLSVHGLLNYLQNSAAVHASKLGFGKEDLNKQSNFWALSRMLVTMQRVPFQGEKITVKTWPAGIDRILAIRDFEISDEDGSIIGTATTSWAVVNVDSRRAVKPDTSLGDFVTNQRPRATLRNADKVKPLKGEPFSSLDLIVRGSDLDINMHVNNTSYIRWAVDSLPVEWLKSHVISELEVNFLGESFAGNQLRVMTIIEENPRMLYSVIGKQAEVSDLVKLSMKWQKQL